MMPSRLNLLRLFLLGGAFALTPGLPASAQAGLEICNKTDLLQSIAIGYKGETDWTSEGWWNIKPGDCATPVPGKLKKRYYYYHARSDGGGFRGQSFMFCTQGKEFTITGDTECEGRGFDATQFREIDTGETAIAFTLTLVDAGLAGAVTGARGPGGGGTQLAVLPDLPTSESPAPEGNTDAGIVQSVNELPRTPDLDINAGDLTTDLPAGEHGTPFTVAALFQGCELEDGRAYCSFHSEGVKMRAFYSGPTPDDVFFALEEMPLNTAVLLTGDEADLRNQIAAVVIRAVQLRPGSDPHASLRRALQGDWESTSDREAEITIRGSELYERNKGKFQKARFLRVAETCEGLRGAGPVLVKTTPGEKRTDCFTLAKADGRSLELAPVRGGSALVFRRVR